MEEKKKSSKYEDMPERIDASPEEIASGGFQASVRHRVEVPERRRGRDREGRV